MAKPGSRVFYGWAIVIAALLIGTMVWGTRYSFGVFFKSLEADFILNRGATSLIFSSYMLLGAFVTIPWGWAFDRWGPRIATLAMGLLTGISLALTSVTTAYWQLFFSYSLLLTLGTAGTYTVLMAVISRWFIKKRGLALGIGGIGSGIGTLVMSPFAALLIESLGWRISYVVLALVNLAIILPLALLMKREPSVMGLRPDGETVSVQPETRKADTDAPTPTGYTLKEALKSGSFWSLWISYFMVSACIHLVTTHIVAHGIDTGISATLAAGVLSIIGGMSIPGRVLAGRASDMWGRRWVTAGSAFLGVIAMLVLLFTRELWGFYVFAAIFGFSWGGIVTMITAIVGDIFGITNLGSVLGAISIAWVTGAAVGPAAGGYIFDGLQSYSLAFGLGFGAMMVTTILTGLMKKT